MRRRSPATRRRPPSAPSLRIPEPGRPFEAAPSYAQPAPDPCSAARTSSPSSPALKPAHEAAPEPALEPEPVYQPAPRASLDPDEVELEPNVGFDVDDELIGPATHLFGQTPAMPSHASIAAPSTS